MEAGRAGSPIFYGVKKLKDLLKTAKERWLDNPNNDGFYFYQAIYNVELILERMEHRLHNLENTGDPKIARDSLVLLPAIDDVLEATECEISKESIDLILDKTRDLRNMAADVDLLESPDMDKQFIDSDQFGSKLDTLMTNLHSDVKN